MGRWSLALEYLGGRVITETLLVAAAVAWCGTCYGFRELAALFCLGLLNTALFPEPSSHCRPHTSTGLLLGTLVLPVVFAVRAETIDAALGAFRLTCWSSLTSNAIRLYSCCGSPQPPRRRGCAGWLAVALAIGASVVALGDVMLLPALVVFAACLVCVQRTLLHSFTLGEAVLVAELCAVLFHVIMFSIILDVNTLPGKLRKVIAIGLFSAMGMSAVNLCIAHLCSGAAPGGLLSRHRGLLHLACTAAALLVMLEWMSLSIGQNSLHWLWIYISNHRATPLKFILYYVAVLVPALALAPETKNGSHRKIVIRKYFHVLAIVMFVPTILIHIRFMALASAVALAIFMVLESLRIAKVPMVVAVVDPFQQCYVDERDAGVAVLTHIYLLMGCALPVFFTYFVLRGVFSANGLLVALSGVTVTGLGDAAASYCGVRFGRRHWHGSRKTLEGTAAMILAMFSFQVACLWLVGFHNLAPASWGKLALADVLVALLEAKTDQIDNLLLPLYHVALLQMV